RRGAPRGGRGARVGPPWGVDAAILKGRRGGTDEFLGRGAAVPQSPRSSGRGGRPLDKGLVQRHADAVIRKSHVAVSEAINRSPVSLLRKKKIASRFRGAPVDKRGHIRVRPTFERLLLLLPLPRAGRQDPRAALAL